MFSKRLSLRSPLVMLGGLFLFLSSTATADDPTTPPPSPASSVVIQSTAADSENMAMLRFLTSLSPTGVLIVAAWLFRNWNPTLRVIISAEKPVPVRLAHRVPTGDVEPDE